MRLLSNGISPESCVNKGSGQAHETRQNDAVELPIDESLRRMISWLEHLSTQ
jgi:hypothetical protein